MGLADKALKSQERECRSQALPSSQFGLVSTLGFLFFYLFVLFIYLFRLHWVFAVVRGLLIVVASLVAEHRL